MLHVGHEIAEIQQIYEKEPSLDSYDSKIVFASGWFSSSNYEVEDGFGEDEYWSGWLESVIEFWNEVKDKI